ncbi:MAG: hypothetical protein HY554_08945 [Elusimicrobia bacterium]|nr:hypothetical protein [Elusimicrobiota bacterium]
MDPPSGRAQPLYFVNAFVDFALIGGLSIATFTLLRLFYTGERTSDIITLSVQLAWICNWPHASATIYRLYGSRENVAQYPMTALVIPWVVVAGLAACFFSPTVVAPCFVKLNAFWSPYHFAGQSLGISLIYARRAGFEFGAAERFALSTFLYSIFVAQAVRFETGWQILDQQGLSYPSLGLPAWLDHAAQAWLLVAGLGLLGVLARRCVRDRRLMPPIILLPVLTHLVWFLPGASWRSFGEFVPFFHGMQYLLVAWSMQLKEKLDREGVAPSAGYVLSESARWGLLNFLGGVALFYGVPRLLAGFGTPLAFSIAVVSSAVQLHHFFVDGVIWKLRRSAVSSPLMAGLDDLLHAPRTPRALPA